MASSTPSHITPSTIPVESPSCSFRNGSPLRFSRRERSRTRNGDSICCPSTRSRTKAFEAGTPSTPSKRGWLSRSICREYVRDGSDGYAPGKVRLMARSVLVAGGTGALGGAVLSELLEHGYPVVATWLVERERERIEQALGDRVQLVQADLLDAGQV